MLPSLPLAVCLFPLFPGVPSFPFGPSHDLQNPPDSPSKRDGATATHTHTVTVIKDAIVTRTTTITASGDTRPSGPSSINEAQIYFLPPNALPTSSPTPADASVITAQDDDDPTAVGDDPVFSNHTSNLPQQAAKPLQGPLVMAYYPDWVADSFPPEKVDFSRFDWIDFAFAVPNERFGLGFDGTSAGPDLLRRLVAAAHAKGKKVKLSIGGWTGSKYFSLAVASAKTRQTFVNNILSLYKQFNLDGIDIDWEYPGQDGNPGNNINPSDTSNFLAFLKLLRATLPPAARISAAVQTQPFADAHGNPLTNAAPFANVLDWVLMMNYDIWGSSSNPGPNAPLSDACHNSTQPGASADAAVRAWTAAGFPPNKLVLGVPSYGYISKSSATRLRGRQAADDASTSGSDGGGGSDDGNDSGNGSGSSGNGTNTNTGGGGGDGSGTFANGTLPEDPARTSKQVLNDDGNAGDGQLQFRSLVSQGVLCPVKGAHGAYNGCNGFTRYWDGCSNTPFLRSAGAGQVVTYDDAESLGLKASYAHQRGILGVNMFDVHGDTDKWELVDSLRAGLRVAH